MKEMIYKILNWLFPNLFPIEDDVSSSRAIIEYYPREYLTYNERLFYSTLLKLESRGDYKVIPQVNLATIVQKKSNQRYQSELYRNIDFVVFNKSLDKVYLLIELNDATHNQNNRKDRDLKVKKICNAAGYKLMTFYTKYPNEENYVLNRITNFLNSRLDGQSNDNIDNRK